MVDEFDGGLGEGTDGGDDVDGSGRGGHESTESIEPSQPETSEKGEKEGELEHNEQGSELEPNQAEPNESNAEVSSEQDDPKVPELEEPYDSDMNYDPHAEVKAEKAEADTHQKKLQIEDDIDNGMPSQGGSVSSGQNNEIKSEPEPVSYTHLTLPTTPYV